MDLGVQGSGFRGCRV